MAGVNNNQNTQQPKRVPITISGYPEAVKDMVRAKYPDFDQVMGGGQQGAMNGAPNGNIPAVAPAPTSMNFFQNNGAVGKYEAPAVQTEPDLTPSTPAPEYGTNGVQFTNPAQPQQNDLSSLSAALNGGGLKDDGSQATQFQADPTQRDGGFSNWINGLMPKKRPGMREGETPDEYDARRTRNMEMVATFADAIRHMGNIVNTAKGAPLQQFNDPTSMLEQGYQNRKAQRQKQAALDADAAYKASNLSIKEAAAKANEAYKQMTLGYRDAADRRAQRQFEYQIAKDAAAAQRQAEQDKQKQSNWERQFKFRQQQAAISNGLRQQSINKRGSGKSGGGRGGSGAAYSLYNPNTGNTEYFKNNNEFLRRAGELGYDTSKPVSTTESSEVVSKDGIKKVSNTKRGTSVNAKIGQQEAQKKKQNANKNARKGSKLKNTSALGL